MIVLGCGGGSLHENFFFSPFFFFMICDMAFLSSSEYFVSSFVWDLASARAWCFCLFSAVLCKSCDGAAGFLRVCGLFRWIALRVDLRVAIWCIW